MELKHLVILLKAEGQRSSASQKQEQWKEIDQKIGKWIKENGDSAKAILFSLWKTDCDKIPVLYGKQGKLSMIPLNSIKGDQNLSFIPKHLAVIENRHFDLFSVPVSSQNMADFYQSDIEKMTVLAEKIKETDWTFSEEEKLHEVEHFLTEHNNLFTELASWHKMNRPIRLGKYNQIVKSNAINRYHLHVNECKAFGFQLDIANSHTVACTNCKSKWQYDRDTKILSSTIDFSSLLEMLTSFLVFKETQKLKEAQLRKEIESIQKRIKSIPFDELNTLQKDLSILLNETKKEEFDSSHLLSIQHEVASIIGIQGIFDYELDHDFCQSYSLMEIENRLPKKTVIASIPKTKKGILSLLDRWKQDIKKQADAWKDYQKNVVKHLPSMYELSGFSVPMSEVKEILSFIQSIDGNFGYHLIADTLKGSKQKKVIEFNLDKKPQYALLSKFKKDDVLDFLHAMAKKGWIVQKGYDYPKIHITENGKKQWQRLIHKEALLTNDTETIELEKRKFMKQSFKQFIASLDTAILDSSWRSLYLHHHYKEKGVLFYKELLQFYKDGKINIPVIHDFIQETFEEKYKPIFCFYQKTSKNESFSLLAKQLI